MHSQNVPERFTVPDLISVEIVYALPMQQTVLTVKIVAGTTIEDAIRESGILVRHPEIDLTQAKVGVYARTVPVSTVLQKETRVEIYRPLIADPKEIRRQRAEKAKLNSIK